MATTAPYGAFEHPFNLPFLADSCGAVYVARWTAYHVRQTAKAMTEALQKRGFSFVEILAPCPTLYQRRNRLGDGLVAMQYYRDNSVVNHDADTRDVGIEYQGKIVCGKFVDRDRPTWLEGYNKRNAAAIGDSYRPYPWRD